MYEFKTFKEMNLEDLELDLFRGELERSRRAVFKDGEIYCVFNGHDDANVFTHVDILDGDFEYWFDGDVWGDFAPFLEADEGFKAFMKSETYLKEKESLEKRFQRMMDDISECDGNEFFEELAHDPFWFEDHIMYHLIKDNFGALKRLKPGMKVVIEQLRATGLEITFY